MSRRLRWTVEQVIYLRGNTYYEKIDSEIYKLITSKNNLNRSIVNHIHL